MSGLEYTIEEFHYDEQGNRVVTKARIFGFSVAVHEAIPPDEVWIAEPLTPLQRAAGMAPRIVAKITDIADTPPAVDTPLT
jgi:hypothetical protein